MTANQALNQPSGEKRSKTFLDFIARERWIIPLGLIVLYVLVYSIVFTDVFLSSYNIASLLLEFSLPAIIVVGMALQLINGEIDLSVGYNVMFANLLAGALAVLGVPIPFVILITLAASAVIGLIIGLLVARVGVNSFIATLGSGLVFYGLAQVVFAAMYGVAGAGGSDIQHLPDSFTAISKAELLGIQLPVYYAVVILVAFAFLMAKSRYFRNFYYIGMNKEAAKLSGINVENMKTTAFVFSAVLASLAGVLLAARMGAAGTQYGKGWELKVITGAVIGGVSFKGGIGSMGGAVLGMLFTICLSNALRIAEAPSNLYKIIEGLILLIAVIIDALFSKRKVVG